MEQAGTAGSPNPCLCPCLCLPWDLCQQTEQSCSEQTKVQLQTELELELLGSGNEATHLVVLELEVKACDEHDLGEVERVLRSLCGCKAGNGACVHKGMACIMQVGPAMPPTPLSAQLSLSVGGLSQEHHWSPMRGTYRPIT